MRSVTLICPALFGAFLGPSVQAQFSPIDHKGEPPSTGISYFRNDGQVTDLYGDFNPRVAYYSWGGYPRVAAMKSSTVSLNLETVDTLPQTPDWNYSLEFKPVGETAQDVNPTALEGIPEKHNFFLGHCPQGVLNVPGYKRVVYENIYPHIDMHLYSNKNGLKVYFVLREGANPDDVLLEFSGQDSIRFDFTGALKIFLEDKFVVMPEALAYQQINGTTQLVSWGLDYEAVNNEDLIRFHFDTYDPNYPLILDISASLGGEMTFGLPPEWGTYFGDAAADAANDVLVLNNGAQFNCGYTRSPMFPTSAGALQTQLLGISDAYFSKFDNQYSKVYTTFYGGTDGEAFQRMAITPDQQSIYLIGSSTSTDIGLTSFSSNCFQDGSNAGNSVILARFSTDVNQPLPQWQTYYGGHEMWGPYAVEVDQGGNVYICGTVYTAEGYADELTCQGSDNTFPLCNAIGGSAFFQDHFGGGARDAFIAKFNSQLELVHSTLFGGNNEDSFYDLAVDNASGQIYFTGYTTTHRLAYTNCQPTTSGGFPLCDAGTGFFQSNLNFTNSSSDNSVDGIVGSFSTSTGALTWSSFVGGADDEIFQRVAVDPVNHKVFFTGYTQSDYYAANTCAVPTTGGFPCCHSGDQFFQNAPGGGEVDGCVLKFNTQTKVLELSTLLGGSGNESFSGLDLTTNESGETMLLVGGGSGSGSFGTTSLFELSDPSYYHQNGHADTGSDQARGDGYVLILDEEDVPVLATYVGGVGNDNVTDIGGWAGERVFLTGTSISTEEFPFNCPPTINPYCDMSYLNTGTGQSDVFHMQIEYDATVGVQDASHAVSDTWSVYPNPTTGPVTITGPMKALPSDLTAAVMDLLGREALHLHKLPTTVNGRACFDARELPSGCWLIQLTSRSTGLITTLPFFME